MELYTTNYYNTFIEVSEDCIALTGTIPPVNNNRPTIANLQFELIITQPYQYSSDELLFMVHASRNDIATCDFESERELLFSKGQACLRTSALAKRYGWGIHADDNGRIAIYARESAEYLLLSTNPKIKHLKAMNNKYKR